MDAEVLVWTFGFYGAVIATIVALALLAVRKGRERAAHDPGDDQDD